MELQRCTQPVDAPKSNSAKRLECSAYTIGLINALSFEYTATLAIFDERHGRPEDYKKNATDNNKYAWGRVGNHNIVVALLPAGSIGKVSAATTVMPLISAFPSIRVGLLVGIGGAVPSNGQGPDIRLGDVVISIPTGKSPGVFEYDFGKETVDGFGNRGFLSPPPQLLLSTIQAMRGEHEFEGTTGIDAILKDMRCKSPGMSKDKAVWMHQGHDNDILFRADYIHHGGKDCSVCKQNAADVNAEICRNSRCSNEPTIHYGLIASGDSVMKDAKCRDNIAAYIQEAMETECLCFEMEAAGLMKNFPSIVIRGISDYSDSHKNDRWQRYAAMVAAACAKELLSYAPFEDLRDAKTAQEVIRDIHSDIKNISEALIALDQNQMSRLKDLGAAVTAIQSTVESHSIHVARLCNATDGLRIQHSELSNAVHIIREAVSQGFERQLAAVFQAMDRMKQAMTTLTLTNMLTEVEDLFTFESENLESLGACLDLLHMQVVQIFPDLQSKSRLRFSKEEADWIQPQFRLLVAHGFEFSAKMRRIAAIGDRDVLGNKSSLRASPYDPGSAVGRSRGTSNGSKSSAEIYNSACLQRTHHGTVIVRVIRFENGENSHTAAQISSSCKIQFALLPCIGMNNKAHGISTLFETTFPLQCSSIPPHIRTWNVVPWDAKVFRLVAGDNIKGLQRLFGLKEASPFDRDPYGDSLLYRAVEHKSYRALQLLIDLGVTVQEVSFDHEKIRFANLSPIRRTNSARSTRLLDNTTLHVFSSGLLFLHTRKPTLPDALEWI